MDMLDECLRKQMTGANKQANELNNNGEIVPSLSTQSQPQNASSDQPNLTVQSTVSTPPQPRLQRRLYPELDSLRVEPVPSSDTVSSKPVPVFRPVDNGESAQQQELNNVSIDSAHEFNSQNSSRDNMETDVPAQMHQLNEDIYGPAGSYSASVCWFKATQARKLRQNNGTYSEWFHGIISRKEAEKLLSSKRQGCFLIRVGESRIGYTLSLKDETRCRHYMIEEVTPEGYRITGERTTHKSLFDLVEYHKKNKLINWDALLTESCTQAKGECNYLELIISPEEEDELLASIFNRPRVIASAPGLYSTENFSSLPADMQCVDPTDLVQPPIPPRTNATLQQSQFTTSQPHQSTLSQQYPSSSDGPTLPPRSSQQSSQAPPLPAPRRSSRPTLPPPRQL